MKAPSSEPCVRSDVQTEADGGRSRMSGSVAGSKKDQNSGSKSDPKAGSKEDSNAGVAGQQQVGGAAVLRDSLEDTRGKSREVSREGQRAGNGADASASLPPDGAASARNAALNGAEKLLRPKETTALTPLKTSEEPLIRRPGTTPASALEPLSSPLAGQGDLAAQPGGEPSEQALSGLELSALRELVLAAPVPAHVGIIMDGNGRWAELQGLSRLSGHREGSQSVREITRCARKLGIGWLTLYAFSSQNWARPPEEVSGLMDLLAEFLHSERDEILNNGVRLHAVGELDRLPDKVREPLEALRAESANNTGLTLTLALSYGGREDLIHAVQQVAKDVAAGGLNPDDVDEAEVRQRLWTANMPDPDLVIRTSGELRLSNFLLFQIAYSEIVVTQTAWPDFRERELLLALKEYQQRERRFGMTGAQVRES